MTDATTARSASITDLVEEGFAEVMKQVTEQLPDDMVNTMHNRKPGFDPATATFNGGGIDNGEPPIQCLWIVRFYGMRDDSDVPAASPLPVLRPIRADIHMAATGLFTTNRIQINGNLQIVTIVDRIVAAMISLRKGPVVTQPEVGPS